MFDSLLTFYCGKDSRKKRKVMKVFASVEQKQNKNEFVCDSFTKDIKYNVIYSEKLKEWFCNCPTITFKKYYIYESKEERNRQRKKNVCCHIIACKIWLALDHLSERYE